MKNKIYEVKELKSLSDFIALKLEEERNPTFSKKIKKLFRKKEKDEGFKIEFEDKK